jgi:hypothetical protein
MVRAERMVTMQMADYSKIDEVSDKGIRLFKVMMRLEFALKDVGYARSGNRQAVGVDWDAYAKEKLGTAFWDKIKGAKEAEVLIQKPPKKQTVNQSCDLGWVECAQVSSIQDLFGAVRRVRNNLFHGGKSGDPDADRNTALYVAALFVIDQVLKEDDVLLTSFSGSY